MPNVDERLGTAGMDDPPEEFLEVEALLVEREEAQGVELFVDPDAVVPVTALIEGAPGQGTLVGDSTGLGRDAEDDTYERDANESYDA